MTFPQLPDMDLDDYTDLEAGFPISRLQPNSKKQKQFIGGSLEGHPRVILVPPSLYPVLSEFIISKKNSKINHVYRLRPPYPSLSRHVLFLQTYKARM